MEDLSFLKSCCNNAIEFLETLLGKDYPEPSLGVLYHYRGELIIFEPLNGTTSISGKHNVILENSMQHSTSHLELFRSGINYFQRSSKILTICFGEEHEITRKVLDRFHLLMEIVAALQKKLKDIPKDKSGPEISQTVIQSESQ
jgi:hypothetical protein